MAPPESELRALFLHHIRAFNHGVMTGNFSPMLKMFHCDATFELDDPVLITHRGLDAIGRAYRGDPPKGTMTVTEPNVRGHVVTADYIWDAEPERIAGQFILQFDGDRIVRNLVTYAPD